MTNAPEEEKLYDQITLVCTNPKCGAKYTMFPLKPLRTSDVKGWLQKNTLRFCDCKRPTCDAKFRIMGSKPAP